MYNGRIPLGCLTLAHGAGDLGKSTVYLDWAARLSRGFDFHDTDNPQEPGDVLLVVAEDPLEYVVSRRLDAADADDSRIQAIRGVWTYGDDGEPVQIALNLIQHVPLIGETLSNLPNPLLLVVDPIGQFTRGDMHRDNEVRELTGALAGLAEEYNLAVLMVGHDSKDTSRSAQNRYLGSVAFRNAVRSVLWFCQDVDDEDRRIIYHTHQVQPTQADASDRISVGRHRPGCCAS